MESLGTAIVEAALWVLGAVVLLVGLGVGIGWAIWGRTPPPPASEQRHPEPRDPLWSGVVDLQEERIRRNHEEGHRAHERGQAFAFWAWDYDDDALGFIEGEHPVVILFRPESGEGVAMTRETARSLARNLLEMLESEHGAAENGAVP